MPRINETLLPPPIETLAVAYLTPLLGGLRVLTRMPPQNKKQETPAADTFIRVEASTGTPQQDNILFRVQSIIHSYAPYNEEVKAEQNIGLALAWMGNAQGTTITIDGYDWFITYSNISMTGHRMADPLTPIARYRGAAQWLIMGQPIAPPAAIN